MIPGSGGSPRGGNGNPFQYSCWENSMDRITWWAAAHGGHKESDIIEHTLSTEGERMVGIYREKLMDLVLLKGVWTLFPR